jgi:perosamine synthetase
MRRRIPVAEPALIGNERKYVLDCLDSSWISSTGEYIDRFESAFAELVGTRHALSCSNGTTALHLALLALGVQPHDEVIVPTLTYVASANAVAYCGATPVFVDSEPDTWNLDPSKLEGMITPRTRGIMVVHLYGHPVDIDPIADLCRSRGLFLLEDAAEAHGAQYRTRMAGSLGDAAIFSFYGNKVITTGEGGMLTTDDDDVAARARLLRGQGMDLGRRYWFPVMGYNYRLTNVAAAIGLAQLEKLTWHLERRRQNAAWYHDRLAGIPGVRLQKEQPWARSSHWMTSIVLEGSAREARDGLMASLANDGVETRPFFCPMHALPMYQRAAAELNFPVADRLSATGINLPSSATLNEADVDYVCGRIRDYLRGR